MPKPYYHIAVAASEQLLRGQSLVGLSKVSTKVLLRLRQHSWLRLFDHFATAERSNLASGLTTILGSHPFYYSHALKIHLKIQM